MDRQTLLTEIALAIGNRSITVNEIIEIEKAFTVLRSAGVIVIGNVVPSEEHIPDSFREVMKFTSLSYRSITEFMEKQPEYSNNKIPIIKNFRQYTGCGLADGKWAVEMLYTGSSTTPHP